jgi:FAD/FMN-containing dehydrogenase
MTRRTPDSAIPTADDLEALRQRVGEAGLVLDDRRSSYEAPARYETGRAAAVLRPATTDAVRAVVSYCVGRGLRIVPQAGNTGLVLGSTPDDTGRDIVVSVDRLKSIDRITPEDRSVSAGAGVRLSGLNAALEPHGLFLPIDLGADPMLGGMAATNTGGARFLRYGDMRAHVLGLDVVLATEAAPAVTLGSGLRKDNARLDLKDLVVGGGAAFGVITGVTVEVHPRPAQTAAALLIPSSPEACPQIVSQLERSAGELLSAVEGMSGAAMRRALEHVPNLRNPFGSEAPAYALLVEFSSTLPPSLLNLRETLIEVLATLVDGPGAPIEDALIGEPSALWALRHSLGEGLRRSGKVVGFDLAFRRDRVFAFRAAAVERLGRLPFPVAVCDFGHVADGGVHFNLVLPHSEADARRRELQAIVLDLAVGEFGGSFSGEHGLGRINQLAYDRYVSLEERQLAGSLLQSFGLGRSGHVRFGLAEGG